MALLTTSIANTHEDYEICIETHVELDAKKRFVITLDEYDFSYPRFNGNAVRTRSRHEKIFSLILIFKSGHR